jgi:translation initiation factor IF-1
MPKSDAIEVIGTVIKCLPNTKFIVDVQDSKNPEGKFTIECYLSGKMRVHYIKIIPGDRVTVQMSPYDLTQGRITFRNKKETEFSIKTEENID